MHLVQKLVSMLNPQLGARNKMGIKGYQTVWEIMKQTADKEELKELEAIEKRYQEKPTALNPLGQKLMKQKANPLDNVADRIVKNHELYDEPGPLEKKAQSGKPLTEQEKSYVKANPYGLTKEAYKYVKAETAPPPQFVDAVKIKKPFVKKQTPKNIGEYYKNKGTPKVATTANQIIQNLKLHMPTIVEPLKRSAEEVAAEKKFNDMMRKAEEEKQRIRNSGIAYFIGDITK
jgi:hypothetical protein